MNAFNSIKQMALRSRVLIVLSQVLIYDAQVVRRIEFDL